MAAAVGSCGGLVQASSGGGCVTPFNYGDRVAEIESWLPDDVRVEMGPFCGADAYARSEDKVIYLPAEILLKATDFPNLVKIRDAEDPNLFDATCLEKFRMQCVGLNPYFCFSVDMGYSVHRLQRLLLVLQDPILYERDRRFTVAHENAHIEHARGLGVYKKDVKRSADQLENAGRGFLRKFIPSLQRHSNHSYAVAEELESDLDAAIALKDATGGIYCFKVERDLHTATMKKRGHIVPGPDYDEDGRPRFRLPSSPPTHPTDSQRIRALQTWQDERDLAELYRNGVRLVLGG